MYESNWRNPVGSVKNEGNGYLHVYSNGRRRNSVKNADLAKTFNPAQSSGIDQNGWSDLVEKDVKVGVSGVPGPNQAKLGQQKLNISFANHDPKKFYCSSFQTRANRSKSIYNKEGLWHDLVGTYNYG